MTTLDSLADDILAALEADPGDHLPARAMALIDSAPTGAPTSDARKLLAAMDHLQSIGHDALAREVARQYARRVGGEDRVVQYQRQAPTAPEPPPAPPRTKRVQTVHRDDAGLIVSVESIEVPLEESVP